MNLPLHFATFRTYLLLTLVYLVFAGEVAAQDFEKKDAILIVSFQNYTNQKLTGTIVKIKNGETYSGTVNDMGEVFFTVPANEVYRVTVKNLVDLYEFRIPNYDNLVYKIIFNVNGNLNDKAHIHRFADSVIFDNNSLFTQKAWTGDAEVDVIIFDRSGDVINERKEIRLADTVSGNAFVSMTEDVFGMAKFLVPKGGVYKISSEDNSDLGQVNVPNNAYLVRKNVIYTYEILEKEDKKNQKHKKDKDEIEHGYIHISLKDNYGKALPDEVVFFEGERSGKVYTAKSDANGNVDIEVPYGDVYTLHFKYERNVDIFDMTKVARQLSDTKVYNYIGSAVLESDDIEVKKDYFTRKFNQYVSDSFSFKDSTVLKVLNRNRQWGIKLIVTDLTGSMYPYAGQVLVWYKLNYMKEKKSQLLFFNDGDKKPMELKRPGKTGGIYVCEDCDYMHLFNTMINTILGGNGGDNPENDIEALMVATYNVKKFDQLILIADNNSPVRDLELLRKVKFPVNIILCGVKDYVSLEYLNIAYKTGGSVHTIEEDITSIAQALDGETITIGTESYKLMNGEFVVVK